MNVVGIGTDITEVDRIAQMLEKHGELFLQRVHSLTQYAQKLYRSGEIDRVRYLSLLSDMGLMSTCSSLITRKCLVKQRTVLISYACMSLVDD